MLVLYHPDLFVCVCILGRFGAFLWQVDSGRGPTGLQVEAFSWGEVVAFGAWAWHAWRVQVGRVEILRVCGSLAWQAWRAWSSTMEIVHMWVPSFAGLRAQVCGVNIVQGCAGLGGMASRVEIVQGWGVWPSKMELLKGCTGFGVMAQQNRDCACLYLQCGRPWGCGPAEQSSCRAVQGWGLCGLVEIVNVCGSLALRAHPMEILQFW
jgi:hypothetical protein